MNGCPVESSPVCLDPRKEPPFLCRGSSWALSDDFFPPLISGLWGFSVQRTLLVMQDLDAEDSFQQGLSTFFSWTRLGMHNLFDRDLFLLMFLSISGQIHACTWS